MAVSKLLVALMLFLAIIGTMGQTMTPAEQKIVATCGVPTALKVKTLAPKCAKDIAKAKTCPSSCKTLLSSLKTPACGAAVNAVASKATKAKIATICKPAGRKMA